MGGQTPKQYLPIGGRPVLIRTIERFHQVDKEMELILVIPESDFSYWKELCREYKCVTPHKVVAGGLSRFQSVRNGLKALGENQDVVAIHDGVRPFVDLKVIQESFEVANDKGSAIAVIPVKDSVRKVNEEGESQFQERQFFRLVQTPQTFRVDKILEAFKTEELPQFTDDATVYENQGWQVTLISGNLENIKITTPDDLDYAEYFLAKGKS